MTSTTTGSSAPAAPRALVPLECATRKRDRDRRSRQRRTVRMCMRLVCPSASCGAAHGDEIAFFLTGYILQATLHSMRATLATLERALPIVLTLDDHQDVQWEGFLDAEALRVRRLMCASLALTKEARRLQSTQYQLKALLREHRIASLVLQGVLRGHPVDYWEADVERWQHLTHRFFRPWTMEACQEEMDAAMKAVRAFQCSSDRVTTGSTLGWENSVRIDTQRSAFTFQFEKVFRGFDFMGYVDVGWKAYTDSKTYQEVVIGHRLRAYHEVIQELDPHVVLVRSVERFAELDVDAHLVNLVFRIPTERGFTQCVRAVCCSEVINATDERRAMWPSNFIWVQWEKRADEVGTFTVRIGGSIGGTNVKYAQQWMLESLSCMMRSEQLGTGRQLISSS